MKRTRRSSIQVVSAHPGGRAPTPGPGPNALATLPSSGDESAPRATSMIRRPVAFVMGTAGEKCATKVGCVAGEVG